MAIKPEERIKQIEKMAKALGDKNRLVILQTIAEKGCVNCTEFTEIINLAQPSVSHHIKILVDSGLINSDKEGRFVKLCINRENIEEFNAFLNDINKF